MSVYEPTAEDRKHCAKCKHHTWISGSITACLYILDTGESRNCQFGVKCDKFEKGHVVNRNFLYSVLDPEVRLKEQEDRKSRNEMIAYKGEALKRMRIKE